MVPKPEIPADIAKNYKQVLHFPSQKINHDDMGGVDGFVVMYMAMIVRARDNKDSIHEVSCNSWMHGFL